MPLIPNNSNIFGDLLRRPDVMANTFAGAAGPAQTEAGGVDPNEASFLKQSLAAGQPLTEIPREGLIPRGLAKLGIISPTQKASPTTYADEQIMLQNKRIADSMMRLNQLKVFGDVAKTIGGKAALHYAGDIFGDLNNLDLGTLAAITNIKSESDLEQQYQTMQAMWKQLDLGHKQTELEEQERHHEEEEMLRAQLVDIAGEREDRLTLFGGGKGKDPYAAIDQLAGKAYFGDIMNDPNKAADYFRRRAAGESPMDIIGSPTTIKPTAAGGGLLDWFFRRPGGEAPTTPTPSDRELIKAITGK